MQMIDWFMYCVKDKYLDLSGRAGRAEYWWYQLAYLLLFVAMIIIEIILQVNYLTLLMGLGLLLPTLGVTVRRLHDTGKSGWWLLIELVPVAGLIVLLVFTLTEGDRGTNRYGAAPRQTV